MYVLADQHKMHDMIFAYEITCVPCPGWQECKETCGLCRCRERPRRWLPNQEGNHPSCLQLSASAVSPSKSRRLSLPVRRKPAASSRFSRKSYWCQLWGWSYSTPSKSQSTPKSYPCTAKRRHLNLELSPQWLLLLSAQLARPAPLIPLLLNS